MDPTNRQPGEPTPPSPWGTDPQPAAPEPVQPTPPWGTAPEPAPRWAAPEPTPPSETPGESTPPWTAPGQPRPPWGTAPGQPGVPQPDVPTPPWGPDPQAQAPQPGQPTPPWGAAPQPTAPWAAPGQPGGPQPGWAIQQPQAPQKSGSMRKRLAVVAIVAVVVVGGLFAFATLNSNNGKVLFSTAVPTADQKCDPGNVVTTVSAKTSVYATYEYTGRMGSDQVTLSVTKDGAAYGSPVTFSVSDTSGTDCGYDPTNLTTLPNWGPGTWKFTLTAAGKTVSEGSLTVTP